MRSRYASAYNQRVNRSFPFLALALMLTGCTTSETKSPAASATSALFGVAVQTADHICFSIRNASLQTNSPVTLVTASEPQSIAKAEVIQPTSSACPGIHNEQPAPSNYHLRLVSGKVERNLPLIAVAADSGQFKSTTSPVQAALEGFPKPVSFRSCTSSDGVHLTAWQGTPLTGQRIWHQYYYLGQDLEPTCTGKDTALQ